MNMKNWPSNKVKSLEVTVDQLVDRINNILEWMLEVEEWIHEFDARGLGSSPIIKRIPGRIIP